MTQRDEVYKCEAPKKGEEYKLYFSQTREFPYLGTKTSGKLTKKFKEGFIENPSWDDIKSCFESSTKPKKSTQSRR